MKSKITKKTVTFKCNISNCIVLKSFEKNVRFIFSPFFLFAESQKSPFSPRGKKNGLIVINTTDMSSLKSRIPIEWLVDELTKHTKTLRILNLIVWGGLISQKTYFSYFVQTINTSRQRSVLCSLFLTSISTCAVCQRKRPCLWLLPCLQSSQQEL